jgi:hypothetical protein
MDPKRRRELSLGAAATVLLVIATWSLRSGTTPTQSASMRVATASGNSPQTRLKNPIPDIDLQALEAERPEPRGGTRNPFRFREMPAPPPPPASVIQQQQAAAAAAQAAQTPVEPPPPPRIPLKYIGEMLDPKNPGKKIAILSDSRNAYYGREGDVIEGRYRIVRIGVESIELAYLDGRGRQTIRQTGQ